jgi:hypothetical protein
MDTFKKRQKEMQRQERAREKAAKRMEKKQQRAAGGAPGLPPIEPADIDWGPEPGTDSGLDDAAVTR